MTITIEDARIRGFDIHPNFSEEDVILPRRATNRSAGYDIFVPRGFDVVIEPNSKVKLPTGLKAFMPDNEYLALHIRSGYADIYDLTLQGGTSIIDADYYQTEHQIWLLIRNQGEEPFSVIGGDRIAQGIFQPYLIIDDDNPMKEQRFGGFSSTGK